MPKRSSTRKPKEDFSQVALRIVQEATSERKTVEEVAQDDSLRRSVMREIGKLGGKKGGKARAQALSPGRRKEIAKTAAAKRWGKKKD